MLREYRNESSQTLAFGLHHHPDGAGRSVVLEPGGTVWFDFGDGDLDDSRSAWLRPTGRVGSPEDPADASPADIGDDPAGQTPAVIPGPLAPGEILKPPHILPRDNPAEVAPAG